MVIKGPKEAIMTALGESGWNVHIHDEFSLANENTLMRLELNDPYINTASFTLAKYTNLKYIILLHPDESYTDVIVFKNFGTTEHIINNAYTSEYGSIYSEELEGTIFFPDSEFKISYEDYSCGETATLEYNFSIKDLWENDSGLY